MLSSPFFRLFCALFFRALDYNTTSTSLCQALFLSFLIFFCVFRNSTFFSFFRSIYCRFLLIYIYTIIIYSLLLIKYTNLFIRVKHLKSTLHRNPQAMHKLLLFHFHAHVFRESFRRLQHKPLFLLQKREQTAKQPKQY